MKLRMDTLGDGFREAGIRVPSYDIREMRERTRRDPLWLHFGGGNIYRAYIAQLQEELIERGLSDRGIIVASCFDRENLDRVYHPYDDLTIAVTMHCDGRLDKRVIAATAEALHCGSPAEYARLEEVASAESLRMITLSITEKGYRNLPGGSMEILAKLLLCRYQRGAAPVAVVSLDNCSENGRKLRDAVLVEAGLLLDQGLAEEGFLRYLRDGTRVSFPWTMIDRITPRPSEQIRDRLTDCGVEEMQIIETKKHSFIAPFVNAEASAYLVIEDDFPAGRPPLEEAGVIFTDRDTVRRTERMKVMTCLNPLHTALAVYGCLLSYQSIAAEMRDPDLAKLVRRVAAEAMPVSEHPGILEPADFLREVIEERLPNPFLPDAPQRIATDTSQKIPIRFGETIRAYQRTEGLEAGSLRFIPFVLAGWLRYLVGVDDRGAAFERSADPRLEELTERLAGLRLGGKPDRKQLLPVLRDASLFGVDLEETGLADRVLQDLGDLLQGAGSVRAVLQEAVSRDTDSRETDPREAVPREPAERTGGNEWK